MRKHPLSRPERPRGDQQKGAEETNKKSLVIRLMVQAYLPKSASNQPSGRESSVDHRSSASITVLGHSPKRIDQTRERGLPNIKIGGPERRVLEMAGPAAPDAGTAAGVLVDPSPAGHR